MAPLRCAVFSAKPYDSTSLTAVHAPDIDFTFIPSQLTLLTTKLADGFPAVCVFVNDDLGAEVLRALDDLGVKHVHFRCTGTNTLHLPTAEKLALQVTRVPSYSPESIAEFTVTLLLSTIRHTHTLYTRTRTGNFSLNGLVGTTLFNKTIALIGTGAIGLAFGKVLAKGFGCRVKAFDLYPNYEKAKEAGIEYVGEGLGARQGAWKCVEGADVVSLHCPLTEDTTHLIDDECVRRMKKGAVILNTARGGLIDTNALIRGLKSAHFGAVGLDVYENEAPYFFKDNSGDMIQDDAFARLLTFPNVLVTGHAGFCTEEALKTIAETSIECLRSVRDTGTSPNLVKV